MRLSWIILVLLSLLGTAEAQLPFMGAAQRTYGGATLQPENAYCGPGDVPNFGGTDQTTTLPTSCTFTALSGTPSPGATTTVASDCSNFQTLINAANAGDTLVIPATTTCTGSYTFPTKSGANISHWITVRTDQIANANFPAESHQATPCQININSPLDSYPNYSCSSPAVLMPSIVTNTTNSSAITVTGTFYRFIGLNITKGSSVTIANNLVTLDKSDHVIVDRCLIHGLNPADFKTKSGVSFRGTHQAVINSWIYDIDWNAPDGFPISGGTGTQLDEGPLKLYNNVLAGGSEAWIFGGGSAQVTPHDIEIRHNLAMKPLKYYVSVGGLANSRVNIKNLGELKNATRVLYEENVASWVWQGQSDQPGSMWNINPSAQSSSTVTGFVNVSGTAVTCATNNTGTPCSAGTGWFAVNITSGSRTSNVVTINATAGSQGWKGSWNPGYHLVIQGLTGTCSSFNGEQVLTNNNTSGVIQFTLTGTDIASCGSTTGAIATDLVATTCAPNGCKFGLTTGAYPPYHITAVTDSEHITIAENLGTVTGSIQRTCSPGLTPSALTTNIVARYDYMSHAAAVGLGMNNGISDCGDENQGSAFISAHDIVWDDIDASFWTNELNACCAGGTGAGIRSANSYVTQSTWMHDMYYAHISGMGLRTWKNGGLGAGGFVFADGLYTNTAITNIQRTSNVATITLASVTYRAGTTIQVSGFTTTYAGLNGTNLTITATTPTTIQYANTGSDIPSTPVSSGTTGSGVLNAYPFSYYKNITFRDSFFTAPFNWDINNGNLTPGGLVGGLSLNACSPASSSSNCTWAWTNMVMGTAMYSGFSQSNGSPYPTTNPDTSSTCTVSGGCQVTDFSNVVNSWNGAMGNVVGNDYHVKPTSPFHSAATDGTDIGANIDHVNAVIAAIYPSFTWQPLVISTSSLTACTHNVYCEQQLLISSGASGQNGFVVWSITSGTVPTGMTFEGYGQNQVNGSFREGVTGNAGWLWGTPTTAGSYPMTFQAEDAAHQKTTINLTLVVN